MINLLIAFCGFVGAGFVAGGSVYYFWGRLSLKLPIAAVSFKPKKLLSTSQFLLLIGVISSLLICAFFDTLLGMFLFFICVVVWYGKVKGPQLIHDYQKNKVQTQMSELFPQTLGMCIQALKTGQTIPQVLEYLSHECSQPLRTEITAVVCPQKPRLIRWLRDSLISPSFINSWSPIKSHDKLERT
jgi:hypothetical protein